jgi:hypothetical protein
MMRANLIALGLAIAVAPGCRLTAAPTATATDHVMFIDQTGSVSAREREAWAATADDVLGRLGLGDSIVILPVHDQTLNAAPLFQARVPAQEVSLEGLAHGKRRLKQIRDAAQRTVRQALQSGKQARASDLVAIVDRVAAARSAGAGRVMRVYVFSDMVHSLPPVNLERTALKADDIVPAVAKIGNEARWRGGMLSGVKFFCVLNGIDSGQRNTVNDRRILGEFWRVLLTSVEAELASFNTHL